MDKPGAIAHAVQAARSGDQRAFEALFRAYQDAIYALVLHFVGDRDLAADLTQDTFVRAWENLSRLRDPAAFGGWLRVLAMNMVRDHFRRDKPMDPLDGAANIVADGEGMSDRAVRQEQESTVRAAVLALPEHQQTVVVMHHLEGRPVDDIAAELDLPRGTVISRLSRGRGALRRRLARFVDEQEG
jgi:RNA polymerase sigma-70 factor (ECF subfamily)